MLYKISEFSSITKISSRMLRYLDHEGILKPKFVDDNGYRYYSEVELEVACKISRLKKYHFSYQEIKDILDRHLENDLQLYRQKVESLKEVAQDYETLILEIEDMFESAVAPICNQYNIQFQKRKPYFALSKRSNIHTDAIESFIENAVCAVQKQCHCALLGNYYISFYDDDLLEETDTSELIMDLCFFQPVAEATYISGFDTVTCEEAMVLSTIHYGSYDEIYNAYLNLLHYTMQEGYLCVGPYSEKYFVDSYLTKNPKEYITEVSIVVLKKS